MAAGLINQFISAAYGQNVQPRRSFLVDKLGQPVASKHLTIVDDPFLADGLGSRPFGPLGLAIAKRTIVQAGRLESLLLDAYWARKLGVAPNGGGTTNLFVMPGCMATDDLIKSVGQGLYVTSLSGKGFKVTNGDYSRGASGIWIENGELTYPVQEVTIAGNMLEMFAAIEAVGDDLLFDSSVCSPSLLIGQMSLAGA
jgi:PmbA protein